MRTQRVIVDAYLSDDSRVSGHRIEWVGHRYRSTSWYRNLRWKYTIELIAYFLIKTKSGKTLERFDHELPED